MGPHDLLPNYSEYYPVPDFTQFSLVLAVTAGLALIALLTNEIARVVEDPKGNFAAARSADGIRAISDMIVVLLLPGVGFVLLGISGNTVGRCLLAASFSATVALFGVALVICGVGFKHPTKSASAL